MKKSFRVNCIGLLLLVIFAVFVSFYFNERVENFDVICSRYNANNCPTNNCAVVTDTTRCAGNERQTSRIGWMWGTKNYNVPSSSYANNPNAKYSDKSSYSSTPATCGTGGYLQKCVTKSLI